MEVIVIVALCWIIFVGVGVFIASAVEAIRYVIDTPRRWRAEAQQRRDQDAARAAPYISRRM
jgi:hypothetical protein